MKKIGITFTLIALLLITTSCSNKGLFECGEPVSYGGYEYTTKLLVDGKCWTSQNMKHIPSSGESWCYDNNISICDEKGRFYEGVSAKGICSDLGEGWKLPTESDLDNLKKLGATGWNGNKLFGIISSISGIFHHSYFTVSGNSSRWLDNQDSSSQSGDAFSLRISDEKIGSDNGSKRGQGFFVICMK